MPQPPLPPLKFKPRFVSRLWGGQALTAFGKALPPDDTIGESWEVYDFPPGVVDEGWTSATVAGGAYDGKTLHDLMADDAMRSELLGTAKAVPTPHGPQFPLLVKFLDARQDLSVQVHPTQTYADTHPEAHLKNEAWFVLSHDDGARLLVGLKPDVTREQFEAALAGDREAIESVLEQVPAEDGKVHYLPSGTVHALGAGIVVAEVQTPSDTTFRVHDFGRVDPKTGESRQLHVKQAMDVIQFGDDSVPPPEPKATANAEFDEMVVDAPQFETTHRLLKAGNGAPLPGTRCSVIVMIEGRGTIMVDEADDVTIGRGEVVVLPSTLEGPILEADEDCRWLETTFPA